MAQFLWGIFLKSKRVQSSVDFGLNICILQLSKSFYSDAVVCTKNDSQGDAWKTFAEASGGCSLTFPDLFL